MMFAFDLPSNPDADVRLREMPSPQTTRSLEIYPNADDHPTWLG